VSCASWADCASSVSRSRPRPCATCFATTGCFRLAAGRSRTGRRTFTPRAQSMLTTDFFHIDAVNGRDCARFVIEIERRVVHLLGVTTKPNCHWATQMARNLFCDLEEAMRAIRYLFRDRETKSTAASDEVVRSHDTETARTPVRAPRANAFGDAVSRHAEPSASITSGSPRIAGWSVCCEPTSSATARFGSIEALGSSRHE